MFDKVAKEICRACENGDRSVNNVLFMTQHGEIMLWPEHIYRNSNIARSIWIATFNTGEGYVGAGRISENELWVRVLVEECILKMRQRKMFFG